MIISIILVCSQNCEKWLLALSSLVYLSVHLHEQLGSYWMDFHEISYLRIFKKNLSKKSSVIKI